MVSPATESSPEDNTTSTEEKPIHILYVDNEVGLLKAVKSILEMQSAFHVETAASVKEAIQKMKAKTVDAIVCDYIMPEKDGLEFLKELRNSGNSIPFIIFTGKGREIVAIEALNLGADQYINKIGKTETVYSELAHGIRMAVTGKKAADELVKSEAKYRGLVETIDTGIATINMEGRYTFVNQALCENLGYSKKEMIGKLCTHFLHPDDKERMMQVFLDTRNSDKKVSVEFRAVHKNGDVIYMHSSPTPTIYKNKIVGFNAIITDITEHKKAEEALRESEKRFRELSELLPEVIFETDSKGWLTFLNHVAYSQFGYSPEEFDSGLNALQMLVPEDRKRAENNIERTLHGEKLGANEYTALRKDGTTFPIIVNSTLIVRGDTAVGIRGMMVNITERKRAERALQESEEKYRTMLEHAPDLIITVDEKGIVTSCNDVLEKNTDFSQNEVVGKHFLETPILQTVDPETAQQVFNSILEGKYPERIEIKWFLKDGTPHISEVRIGLTRKDDKIVGFTAIVRDITKQKKAEEKLQESEEKFRNLAEKSPNMIFINKKGNVVYANTRCEEIMGYKKEEFYSPDFNFFTLIAPECLELLKSNYSTHLNGKDISPYEYSLITKEGKRLEAILTSKLMNYEGEQAILGIITDITERKKTNEQLKESERKYRLLTENITDIIYIQDTNLNVTYASPSVKAMSGYTPEELMKLRPDKFMAPESFERGTADFKEAFTSTMKDPNYEIPLKQYEYVRKDGSTFWGELKMKMLRDANDNIVAVQGTLRDITERKRAEKELDDMMSKLMAINEKLGVVGRLTRHDARNKLSVIANNVYLAKQKLAADDGAVEFLSSVESAVDQMEEIFEFSRNYELLGVEDLLYMDVGSNVEEAAILLSGMKGVKLVNECRGLMVMADSLLRQLFYNLIEDTLKYGETVKQIRVHYEEGKKGLKLFYEDDGIGIAKNEKEKLFREGYGKSTGYGLYLIQKICREYGWTIKETGVFGKGVQFTITIPKTTKNGKPSYRIN
jgi:PAS domain S-box-containing protein